MSATAEPGHGRRGPLRFLGASIGSWVLGRIVVVALLIPSVALVPEAAETVRGVEAARVPEGALRAGETRRFAGGRPARARWAIARAAPSAQLAAYRQTPVQDLAGVGPRDAITRSPVAADARGGPPPLPFDGARAGSAEAFAAPPVGGVPRTGRWSGQAYLFARGGAMRVLSPGGQLGGSQAGVRIVRRIDDHTALTARVSTPTRELAGAEAAIGIDWLPFGIATPLRVSAERRVALGRDARDAWSAYVAGGFYREFGAALVVDGYAQAGVVGTRRRDLFADAAVRIGRAVRIGPTERLTLGAGVWGAAQPRVERLDIGPRAAVSLPLGPGTTGVLALEGRIRVAGAAQPGSALAVTLATDF